MRCLFLVLLALAAMSANAAPNAAPAASSCLKFPPAVESGCVSLPDLAAFPKLCSEGYALPAVEACTKVIESGPAAHRIWAYFFRGMANGYVHRLDDALRDYTAVLAEKPDFFPALAARGSIYTAQKKFDLARKDLDEALNRKPDSFEVLTAQSLLYLAMEKRDEAYATLQLALAVTPQTADAYYSRGFFMLEHFQADETAIADFTRALELQPDHDHALLNRSDTYARIGRMDLAEKDCNTAASLKVAPASVHFCFAMMHFIARRYAEALQEYRAVVALRPDKDYVWNDCASIELLTGKYAEALADLDHAIAVNPAEVSSYTNRGIAHRRLGQIDLALADYSKALEIDPKNVNAHINRGALYLATNDFERAEADFAMALSVKPDDANAQRGLDHAKRKIALPPGMSSTVIH